MFVCYFLRLATDEEKEAAAWPGDETSSDEAGSSGGGDGSSSDESNKEGGRGRDLLKDARVLFRWQGRQRELARRLWDALDEGDEEAEAEALLRVLASFIFEGTGDDPFSSGLVHFIAVLGIDAEMGRLRTAKNYSYMLAGVVYCTRVIAAEALLPSAKREEQTDVDREGFIRKRREFLADGSFSPMSEMLSLLAYGKFIALNTGNSGNAFWSRDKKTFHLNGRPIVLSRFQQMAQDVVADAEDRLWRDLLWTTDREDRFTINLDKLVDDVTFTKRGSSFVDAQENGLTGGLQWMLGRMLRDPDGARLRGKEGAWRVRRAR
jgi:hypothetical protein